MSESILIELYPYDPATTSLKTVGFAKGLNRTKVTGSNVPYNLRLESTFSHDISVFENDIPSGSKTSIGTVAIKNADGKFNYLFDYEWGARQIKVYRGWNAKQFSDYILIFDGSTMAINADRNTITFTVTEKASLIPEQLQTNTYTGAGSSGGYADLKGQPKPLCFGYCKNIKPILVDMVKQIWQVHDGTIDSIEGVYDGGVPLTNAGTVVDYTALVNDANKPNDGSFKYTTSGYFRLGAPPAKFINADVRGQFYSEVNLPDTIREILLARTPLTSGDLDGASFDALATRYPGRCSGLYYAALDIGFVEWLENIISSLDSFWYFNAIGKLVVKPFSFNTPVAIIRNEKINNLRRESSSRPLKEVEVLYDRNSEVIPNNEFTLVVQDLNLYTSNKIIRVATDAAGAGGTYSYTGTIEAVMNGENVSDLGAVAFYCAAPWLSISPDGSFTISDPGSHVAYADVTANYGEFTAGIRIELYKSLGVTPTKQLTLATTDYIFDYDQNGYPINPSENSVITATRTNVTSPLVWTATDNVGDPVTLTGTGDTRTLTASTTNNGPLSAHVDIRATSPDGTWQETRVILSRGSTGYFNPLADLLSLADSKVDVFYQDNAPTTGMAEGDLWFDTNDGNKLYRRVSGSWVFINDARIAQAITNAATAQGTADGKISLYNTTSTPTATAIGDLWYNPTTKAMQTWTGSIWVLSADITSFNTAAAITGQGYLALQNYADWTTRIIGTGKPSDNAGTTLNLYESVGGYYTIQGNKVTKITANAWDQSVFSSEFSKGSAFVSGTLDQAGTFIGLIKDRAVGSYTLLDYSIHWNFSGDIAIYEAGTFVGNAFTASSYSNVQWAIVYDGSVVRYLRDGVVFREVRNVATNLSFWAGVAIYTIGASVSNLQFGPAANMTGAGRVLTPIGTGSAVVGNTMTKVSGTHGAIQGGCVGTKQRDAMFVSCGVTYASDIGGGWRTTCGFDPNSESSTTTNSGNVWLVHYTASVSAAVIDIVKDDVIIGTFYLAPTTETTRIALVYNGRRIFAMVDGVVYGGNSSAYDVLPGWSAWPKILDFHLTVNAFSGGIRDIQYGAWNDVRTYLDDGYTILNQAGFRTVEGTAAGIAGQGPGATASASDVLNYVDTVGGGNGMTIIRQPLNGFFADEGTVTGMIKISLPQNFTNTMIRFAVDIFDYASGSVLTYLIAGYTSGSVSSSDGYWINTSASFIGPEVKSLRVRFGYDGSKCCVWIGEPSTVWQFPKVVIRDVMLGYVNQAASLWKTGWVVRLSTAAPTNTSASYVGVIPEVTKPRPGDAVFGESMFESAGSAVATLANFKTLLGTAAAIIAQGALATKNNVDLSAGGDVIPRGAIPPMLPDNGFTYTSTTTSITYTWPSMTIYRPDGTTISIGSGNQTVTGLGSGVQYRVYPYIVDNGTGSGSIGFVTSGGSPVYGSPAILYASSGNVTAASQTYLQNRISMVPFNANTTTSGSGGGGGGGFNCLHEDTWVGGKKAVNLLHGDIIDTPTGPVELISVAHHSCSRWIELYSGELMIGRFTTKHILYRAKDGSEVIAEAVKLGDILTGYPEYIEITGLRLNTNPGIAVGLLIDSPHLHYAGEFGLLCHNGTSKP